MIKNIDVNTPVLWTVTNIAKDLNISIEIVDRKDNVLNLCYYWSQYQDKFYYVNIINNTKVWKKIQKTLNSPISVDADNIDVIFINSRNKTKTIINNISNNIINMNVFQLDDIDCSPWFVSIKSHLLSSITGDDRVIINVDTKNNIKDSDLEDQNKLFCKHFKSDSMYILFNINNIYTLTF